MLGREVFIPQKPALKIVSIVPSQTELLYEMGLKQQIVGQTLFCVHPQEEYKSEKFVGGTKQLDIAKIKRLNPDIIIANKEENSQEQIRTLENEFPIWISDVSTLSDNQKLVSELGDIFQVPGQANWINQQISMSFGLLEAKLNTTKTCLYFIWRNPYMTAGSDTFIDAMLEKGGYVNIIKEKRYPELKDDDMHQLNPEVVFLSSEPYPFKEKHILEIRTYFPKTEIRLVNGEYFSWYGSRLIKTPSYLMDLHKSLTEDYA